MATLSVTRSYDDGVILLEADLDSFLDDIETFLNITKINDDNIQNSGITGSTKLVNASVTLTKMAANSIGTTQLVNDSVTNVKMATNSVDTDEIVDDAVTTAKILDANITTAKVADSAVTTAKIADASIVPSKFGAGNAAQTIKTSAATFSPSTTKATWHALSSHTVTLTKVAEDSAVDISYNPKAIYGSNPTGTLILFGGVEGTQITYTGGTTATTHLSVALFRNDTFVAMISNNQSLTVAIGLTLDSPISILDTEAAAGSCVYQIKYRIDSPGAHTLSSSSGSINAGMYLTAREVI